MSSGNNIWRLHNNSNAKTANGVVGDLAANQVLDVPADKVTIGWGTGGPFSSIERIYAENTGRLNFTSGAAPIIGIGTGNNQLGRAQLITNNGKGTILYDTE